VLLYALSLFGPGELRALRVGDADVLRIILATVADTCPHPQISQALDSLCAVEVTPSARNERMKQYAAAIIERCASTVTELSGPLPPRLLCQTVPEGPLQPLLARCTRLECLMPASRFTPAAWLGLSQLHTLRGVDLTQVSLAAIAAALPRLHTLTALRLFPGDDPASTSGFFTDLLPRLRVFHFKGNWSDEFSECPSLAPTAPPPPLPLLEDLAWDERFPPRTVLHRFLGAQPTMMTVPYDLIAECLAEAHGDDDSESDAASSNKSFLARVCNLFLLGDTGTHIDLSNVAQMLRAAPQMRTLTIGPTLRGDTSCLTASVAPLHPAFVGLVHPRLRQLGANVTSDGVSSRDELSAMRLQRACFPRLRSMRVVLDQFICDMTPTD
jgi:hypothetical protein